MSAREEFEQFVVPHFAELVQLLRPSLLLDHLRLAGLINRSEYRELYGSESSTDEDRSRKLLIDILPRKGKGAFRKFCEILSAVEGQEFIVSGILNREKDLGFKEFKGLDVTDAVHLLKIHTRYLKEFTRHLTRRLC